jgi:hypothetical protein
MKSKQKIKHGIILFFLFICSYANSYYAVEPPAKRTIEYPDGRRYAGETHDGKKHGIGILTFLDGSEYRGGFLNDVPEGAGLYIYPDGKMKKTFYKNGALQNSRWARAGIFEEAVYGKFFFDGSYSGWFKGNAVAGFSPHGSGIMRYKNGSVYSGQWNEGKMHGNGHIVWSDGSRYAGRWIKGKRTGFGSYTWPNGEVYTGIWSNNEICGPGILYRTDGSVERINYNRKRLKNNYSPKTFMRFVTRSANLSP